MANYRCIIHGLLGASRPWTCTFHLTGGLTESAMETQFNNAVTALWTTAADGIQNLTTSDVTVVSTETQTLNASMKKLSGTPLNNAIAGTAAGASLPWKDAVLIEMYNTGQTSKRFHGKVFLPTLAQSQLAADVYIAAATESLQDVLDVFFPAIHASGMQSFSYNQRMLKDGTPPFTVSTLNQYRISDKPSTQRRRVRKIIPTYTIGTAF